MCTTDLMQRYCEGNQPAFRDLYVQVAPKLLGYLRGLSRDQAVAEDLLQQTFLKVHHARASYVRGADPVPWIFTIAHRTFLDHARQQRRSPVRVARTDDDMPEIETNVRGAIAAHEPAERHDEAAQAAVLEAVGRLPEAQRLALVTTKLEGRTMAQAASILGTTEGALKVRAHRAYAALRAALAEAVAV